ncbi:hypothetical protein [Fibrobacter succinogenes]|uniref:hypothetical protein n=1 Tax=Fibrobacter succinogenes TaxID=833 RepID=UPI001567E074|nr:hypothetical protein [Fibrobacter succinogenes]
MAQNSSTIKFYLGDESRLVIDDFSTKDESMFKDSYSAALSIVKNYISGGKKPANSEDATVFFRQTADVIDNNIIAFIGERGTGKSSCMLSVANLLKNISDANDKVSKDIYANCNRGFEILETIDPSFFDEKTKVLEIVLGRMFSNFRKKCENTDKERNEDFEEKKDRLFKAFQTVKESLVHINGCQVNEDDCVDGLLKLTASVDLRDSIKELVSKYLEFTEKEYLVISVDDLDLNTQYAYEMAEQIRKYLRQEKVIILIALKLEQLEKAVQSQFEKQYKDLSTDKPNFFEMTSKYINKLFPEKNRVFLPNIDVWYDAEVQIFKQSNNGIEHNGYKWEIYDEKHNNQTLKYYVVSLIFQKTRYLFYHTEGRVCPIVPRNLRELRHLLGTLCAMHDHNDREYLDSNKQAFKEYFLKIWAPNNLDVDSKNFILDLFNISNPAEINKTVIQKLSNSYKDYIVSPKKNTDFSKKSSGKKKEQDNSDEQDEQDELEEQDNRIEEINRIRDVTNTSYNITIGDILLTLTYLKERLNKNNDKMFIFAIETFYSMRLYEYYDLMVETRKQEYLDKKKNEEDKKTNKNIDATIKKQDALDGLTAYEMLVGGAFVNTQATLVLSPQKNYNRRDIRSIKKETIDTYFDEIDKNGTIDSTRLKWIEFFILFASRNDYSDRRKDVSDEKWRRLNKVIYKTPLKTKIKFDVFSIFSNIVNTERQYKRYNEKLYEIASKEGVDSLYNQFKKICYETRNRQSKPVDIEWDKTWSLLSSGSIRNIDVLEALVQKANLLGEAYHKESEEHLQNFLNKIAEFNIRTYDIKNVNDRYIIQFEFASVLRDFLKSQIDEMKSPNNDGKINIFDSIYNSCNETNTDADTEANTFSVIIELNEEQARKMLKKQTVDGILRFIHEINPSLKKNQSFNNYWKNNNSTISIPKDISDAQAIYNSIITAFLNEKNNQ